MLSAETAVGQYPVEVVQVMDRIVRAAEVETGPCFVIRSEGPRKDERQLSFEEAICAVGLLGCRDDRRECDRRLQRTGNDGPAGVETTSGCPDH
jgi:hypothetical protein